MNFLISPAEPISLRSLPNALTDSLCEKHGADFMMFSKHGTILVQRKTPDDFIASIQDGRLSREISSMIDSSQYRFLLIEGRFRYSKTDNYVSGHRKTRWKREGIEKQKMTISSNGVIIVESYDLKDTPNVLEWIFEWVDKGFHTSLGSRPSLKPKTFYATTTEEVMYFYQGIPHISVKLSILLRDVYPIPSLLYKATVDDLLKLKGIGKFRATEIYDFLHKEGK